MLPLNTGWRIFADDLPARLTESEPDTAFHLPGADALADFSDLLGESACPDSSEAAPTDAPSPETLHPLCGFCCRTVAGFLADFCQVFENARRICVGDIRIAVQFQPSLQGLPTDSQGPPCR